MIETPRAHEPLIDWLRALASLAVVVFHINEVRDHHDTYGLIVSYGWLGVPVFFVVSGYCVTLSSLSRPSPWPFLVKRYVRVLPPYWASLVVVTGVAVARRLLTGANDVTALPNNLPSILATLMLTTKPVTTIPTMNWVYWTLSYELAFYSVMALALVHKRLFPWIILAVTGLCAVIPAYPLTALPGLFFLNHWPLFAIGIALAEILHGRRRFGIAVLILGTVTMLAIEILPIIIAASATALAIWFIRRMPRVERRIDSPVSRFLGTTSYSLYLIHVPIGIYVLGRIFTLDVADTVTRRLGVDATIVLGCIAASWVFHIIVERPAQNWSRGLFRKDRVARAGD